MTKLKPCPFCGSTAVDVEYKFALRTFYYVVCNYNNGGCGASSGICTTEEEAVWVWNRRVKKDD